MSLILLLLRRFAAVDALFSRCFAAVISLFRMGGARPKTGFFQPLGASPPPAFEITRKTAMRIPCRRIS